MEKNNTSRTLNELLVNLFNNVMDREAKAVITEEFKDITNNDMHIIEAIGIEEPENVSNCQETVCYGGNPYYQYEQSGRKGLYQEREKSDR